MKGAAPSWGGDDLRTPSGARTFLEELVATASPSGHERAAAELCVARLGEVADEAFIDPAGNAVAVVGRGERELLLLGHIDTVAGFPTVQRKGDLLYGRGSVDAKGSAVALAVAMLRVAGEIAPEWRIRWVGAVGEEAPGSPGASALAASHSAPELMIVGEPSGVDGVTFGYKGQATLQLSVAQSAGHSAADRPSASDLLVARIAALQRWRESVSDEGAPLFERLQLTTLAIDSEHDGLQERARARLSWRLPPSWPPERLQAALVDLAGPTGGWILEGGVAAVRSERDGVLGRAFRRALRSQGLTPRPKVKSGTSDWNVVAQRWSTPAVAYGPGDAALDHTPEEHLDLRDLDRSIEVLCEVLRLCCSAGPR